MKQLKTILSKKLFFLFIVLGSAMSVQAQQLIDGNAQILCQGTGMKKYQVDYNTHDALSTYAWSVTNSIGNTNPTPSSITSFETTINWSSILPGDYVVHVIKTTTSTTCTKEVNLNVKIIALPTTSVAGSAITQCNNPAFNLAGNVPSIGTGAWTVTSGSATIANTSSATSAVTVTAGNSATLTWTISNGTCTASTSSVVLTNNIAPTTSVAGSAITQCNTPTFTLAGNIPTTGTGLWTVTSGTATITTPSSATSGVTGIAAGTSATLTWTISNGTCTASTSSVVLTNNASPTASIVYASAYCGIGTGAVTLTGPTGGTYSSLPTGLIINGTGDIDLGTSTAGTYTVTYTFTNGTCPNSTTASVTVNPLPTTSAIFHD